MNKKNINNFFGYNLGMGIVFFFFSVFLTSTLFYFLNWKVSEVSVLLSFLLVTIYWFFLDKNRLFHYLVSLSILLIGSLFISSKFYDFSGDGQSYQQAGVIQIALDWNPIKELIVPDVWDSTHTLWMNHFPRFSWIVHGVIYKILGRLEMSKILNLMLVIANFLVGFSFLKIRFKRRWVSVLISTLVALNPISVSQLNTFCVDTLVASLFGLLMWNIFIFLDEKILIRESAFSMFLVTIILFNIKWTTLAYVFVIFVMVSLYLILLKKEQFFKWLKIYVLAGVFGIFILGFDPYVTNTIKYGNPFYPIYFKNPKEINELISPRFAISDDIWKFMAKANSPGDFIDKSWWWKFWRSLFSVSANPHILSYDSREVNEMSSKLKIPFTIRKGELQAFTFSDVRLAGFGVWFSGAMILSFLLLIFVMFRKTKYFWELLFVWIIILIACRFNPESWWARYVPFLWFVPVLTVYWCFRVKDKTLYIGGIILGLILSINLLFIFYIVVPFQWKKTKLRIDEQNIMLMTNISRNLPVKIDFIASGASRMQYFEKGISLVETKIESGIMENYFLKNLNANEAELMRSSYVNDDVFHEYYLKNEVSKNDLIRLAEIFKTMKAVPLNKVTK